jgi:hypothetical protein
MWLERVMMTDYERGSLRTAERSMHVEVATRGLRSSAPTTGGEAKFSPLTSASRILVCGGAFQTAPNAAKCDQDATAGQAPEARNLAFARR